VANLRYTEKKQNKQILRNSRENNARGVRYTLDWSQSKVFLVYI